MEITKHKHNWIKKDEQHHICLGCNKQKLILNKVNDKLSIGNRTNKKGKLISYSVRQNRERIFKPEEWKSFYDALTSNQRLTFKLLLISGARIMEIQHLRKEDIEFKEQRIILRKVKHFKEDNKKSNTRILRISKSLTKELKEALDNKDKSYQVFRCNNPDCDLCKDIPKRKSSENTILSTPAANIAMKKTLQKIKVSDWFMMSIHSIRKTSETWALALGIDSMILSKRFGHNLITSYQHYSQSDAYTFKEKDTIKEIFEDTFI